MNGRFITNEKHIALALAAIVAYNSSPPNVI